MRGTVLAVAVLLVVTTGSQIAAASPDEVATEVSKQVMSPFCPGITLHDCPTRAALDLRERIESWAAAGWSRQRILDELVAEYGPAILATPDDPLTRVARILPVLVLLAGIVLVARSIYRWQADSRSEPDLEPTPSERSLLDSELEKLRAL